jgi:steroid Delta-isomerase
MSEAAEQREPALRTTPIGGAGGAERSNVTEHPARLASQRSMAAVEAGDREAWLALFTDDAVVEDPIGPSPLNPGGQGRRGRAAIAGFWDEIVAMGQVRFRLRESYACGDECANVGRISTTLPDGTTSVVEGVFTYRVGDDGRLVALRAFWEFDNMTFEAPS